MSVELPSLPATPPSGPGPRDRGRDRLVRRAKVLSWVSLGWMTLEGAVGIAAALLSGSVALLGFGVDSAIEGLASVIVIWRFSGGRQHSEAAEQRAQKLVAVSFFLLAPYVAAEAVKTLVLSESPDTSFLGIGLSVASIVLMPLLGRAKRRIGRELGSGATAGEGTQNLLCASMAAGILLGLVVNAAFGLWWLDPVIALGIAAMAVNEGRESWNGEACCRPAVPVGHTCQGDRRD